MRTLAGHSDTVSGVAVTADRAARRLRFLGQDAQGVGSGEAAREMRTLAGHSQLESEAWR